MCVVIVFIDALTVTFYGETISDICVVNISICFSLCGSLPYQGAKQCEPAVTLEHLLILETHLKKSASIESIVSTAGALVVKTV